ncbi:UDP-N-acetylmuramate dehydrogenase [Rhodohalobacter sulfatireducens]|uniref:UDP-N-acetylenolpyruvoylglucosamine reductase n=1 Tax=Rhodohalobacter sulfatireducens TaxID=2911366 RepID=A0ABS9KDW2_9BACT|nr:UDP-N-acetylmuramate dehydrogenase [Rhodohalobacter sulfatireducens]
MNRSNPQKKTDVDLTSFNTLGVSAVANNFVDVECPKDLYELYEGGFFEHDCPFVLGGGSNILFLENPAQPILKVSIKGKDIIEDSSGRLKVKIGAGENWHEFVTWAVKNNYGSVENLALIPGTVGAAPIQNIGAYGVELDEVFDSLELFDMRDGIFKTFQKEECRFGYRDSIFKKALKRVVVVTRVTLNLTTENHQIEDSYKSLQSYLSEKRITEPSIKDIYEAVIDIRRSKLPDPNLIGNAGSFFKNPIINRKQFEELHKRYDEMPFYELNSEEIKIPAAWLIEKTGWKGKRIGDVGTYKNQALVIVNHGNATGSEIFSFSKKIQHSVFEEFGIELVPEVNIVE